jgi:hypothetical protein
VGLDIVEMFMEVESTFGVEILDEAGARLTTVGALYDYVATHVQPTAPAASAGVYSGELWERYLDVLEREIGVKRSALRPEASFVHDLRMD